jgi:hypothetical protein
VFTLAEATAEVVAATGGSPTLTGECVQVNWGTWGGSDPWNASPPPAATFKIIPPGTLAFTVSVFGTGIGTDYWGAEVHYFGCYSPGS